MNGYSFDENKMKQQFDEFMKSVYENADRLNDEMTLGLLDVFKPNNDKKKEISSDIANRGMELSNKLRELHDTDMNLEYISYNELKSIAKRYGVENYWSKKKEDLIQEVSAKINEEIDNVTKGYSTNVQEEKYTNVVEMSDFMDKNMKDISAMLDYGLIDNNSPSVEKHKEFYSTLFNEYRDLRDELKQYEQISSQIADLNELINRSKTIVESFKLAEIEAEKLVAQSSSNVDRIIAQNNLEGIKNQIELYNGYINKYKNRINNILDENPKFKSPSELKKSIMYKFDALEYTLQSEVPEDLVVDVDKLEKDKSIITSYKKNLKISLEKPLQKEEELNSLLEKHGMSRNITIPEEKKNIVVEDIQENVETQATSSPVVVTSQPVNVTINRAPSNTDVLPGIVMQPERTQRSNSTTKSNIETSEKAEETSVEEEKEPNNIRLSVQYHGNSNPKFQGSKESATYDKAIPKVNFSKEENRKFNDYSGNATLGFKGVQDVNQEVAESSDFVEELPENNFDQVVAPNGMDNIADLQLPTENVETSEVVEPKSEYIEFSQPSNEVIVSNVSQSSDDDISFNLKPVDPNNTDFETEDIKEEISEEIANNPPQHVKDPRNSIPNRIGEVLGSLNYYVIKGVRQLTDSEYREEKRRAKKASKERKIANLLSDFKNKIKDSAQEKLVRKLDDAADDYEFKGRTV